MQIDWDAIVCEHGAMVVRTAMRILGNSADAEDVAQETFLEAATSSNFSSVQNWGGLLRRIATYRALDRRRQRRIVVALPVARIVTTELSPVDAAAQRELAEQLRNLIASLPPREGAVFALRYFDLQSNAQIAAILQISVGAVAAAVHKVRSKLEHAVLVPFHGESS